MNDGVDASQAAGDRPTRLRVWDAPVRLFHWTLVLLIAASWWTGEEKMLDWHRLTGYSILALVLFRLLWGLFGSSSARFSNFVRSPRTVASYVRRGMFRRASNPHIGHNPLGGWSVIAMLAILLVQSFLGMIAVDIDGIESGPFSYLVDFDTGRLAAELHHQLFNLVLAVIGAHIVAVLFYLFYRRDNLISPMIVGSRESLKANPTLHFAPWPLALVTLVGIGFAMWALISWFGQAG